jgi:uncharacterized Zn finger protein (UPF0148 family)
MAALLRQGSTLTEHACPACASPLFRLKNGELWCERCRKKVIVVKEEEEETRAAGSSALTSLEATLLAKVQTVQKKIEHEEDPEELQKLNTVLAGLLDNLEKIRKTKKK